MLDFWTKFSFSHKTKAREKKKFEKRQRIELCHNIIEAHATDLKSIRAIFILPMSERNPLWQ